MEDVKVSKIGLIDMLKFKNQVKAREKVIASAEAKPFPKVYATNENARLLHPEKQILKITAILPQSENAKTFVFATADGAPAAYFRAGQYLSFRLTLDGSVITRPVSLCSAPAEALRGQYAITVKRAGFASDYMLDHWQVGDTVETSAPLGNFYYTKLRDARQVIGLAGGSGITPFLSMALAIADGTENFNLTLLYGSRTREDILFREELAECGHRSGGKVKVVHVLSGEEVPGFEHGFITAELIKKYVPQEDYSIFLCGPAGMYSFLDKQIETLHLERKWVRHELQGEVHNPEKLPDYPNSRPIPADVKITVRICGEEQTITASTGDTILQSLEKHGIAAPAHCRSGECGWCHSLLLSGEVYCPKHLEHRREADLDFGYIHPCCTFPLSDIAVEVPYAK